MEGWAKGQRFGPLSEAAGKGLVLYMKEWAKGQRFGLLFQGAGKGLVLYMVCGQMPGPTY
jgi:hypothetical protein